MSNQELPAQEHSFTLDLIGSDSRLPRKGNFVYKRPGIFTQSEISKTLARLNGDLKNLDEDMQFIHEIIAMLRHTLIEAPKWFVELNYGYHEDFRDTNVLLELYKETREFEKSFREKVWGDQENVKISKKKNEDEQNQE